MRIEATILVEPAGKGRARVITRGGKVWANLPGSNYDRPRAS